MSFVHKMLGLRSRAEQQLDERVILEGHIKARDRSIEKLQRKISELTTSFEQRVQREKHDLQVTVEMLQRDMISLRLKNTALQAQLEIAKNYTERRK